MEKRFGKIKFFILPLILIIISACSTSRMNRENMQKDEVLSFFENYIKLSDNFDPAVFDLYKDTAKIIVNDKYPLRRVELSGFQFKKMKVEVLKIAKQKGNISKYSNIIISFDGKKAKIKADRVALRDRFQDKSYYMIVEKGLDGKYKIIEEYVETSEKLKPVNINDLLKTLRPVIENFNKQLPRMLDPNTRMDKVEIEGRSIRYYATILNADEESFNRYVFKGLQEHRIRLTVCDSKLKNFINAGAVLVYIYRDKKGKLICSVDIDKDDCRK